MWLLPWASKIREADPMLRTKLNGPAINDILAQIPELWLPMGQRADYAEYFHRRLESSAFVEGAVVAGSNHARA